MMRIHHWNCRVCCVLAALTILSIAAQAGTPSPDVVRPGSGNLVLQYRVHWRFWHAGTVKLRYDLAAGAGSQEWQSTVEAQTRGFVDKLFHVDNHYVVEFDRGYCAESYLFNLREGGRRRRISADYNHPPGKVSYLERDIVRKTTKRNELRIAPCTHDELAALGKFRSLPLEPGQRWDFPISNGKKFAQVKVHVLRKTKVSTSAGSYDSPQCEAFVFNNVLYKRRGRLLFWLTDDERKIPVQVRFKLPFYIGTVTLELIKEETL